MARILNDSQYRVFNDAIVWYKSKSSQTFEISGAPGTGKSFTLNEIINALGIPLTRVAPMAYTGSAVINMRNKGMDYAKTIFSWIYDYSEVPILDEYGKPKRDPKFNKPLYKMVFIPKETLPDIDLIVIDEAGMVPEHMRRVIDNLGIPVIAVGDINQLPPIAGKPGYLTNPSNVHMLTQIMRQAEGNTIIQFSQMLLKGKSIPHGHYANVDVLYEDEVTDEMLARAGIIICGKNDTRDKFNNHIRHNIYGFTNSIPNINERVVCRKNNWDLEVDGINLTNGLVGNCISMADPSCFNLKDNTFKMCFKPDIINGFFNVDVDYIYLSADKKERDYLMQTHHTKGDKFEFGYAITTHMSQGSEFDCGIYFEEYLNKAINSNLHYVGITRFKQYCIYVKKRPKRYW